MITRAKRIARARYLAAGVVLVGLNLQFLGVWLPNLQLGALRGLCSPVFWCHSCPWATMACPIGVLVNFGTLRVFPFIALGILGLVGTFGGRLVCGWICPFGLLQDLLHKIPTPKYRIPRKLCYTKYILLGALVFAVPVFLPGKPWSYCKFCPAATLTSTLPRTIIMGEPYVLGAFIMKVAILVGVLALAVFVSRGFCRTMCPLGAIFSLFNRFSLFRFRLAHEKCNNCGVCAKNCPVDIDPVKQMNTAECIRCLDCTHTGHIKLGMK